VRSRFVYIASPTMVSIPEIYLAHAACLTHSRDAWRFRHDAFVNSEKGGDPCFSSAT
jgi:hypothetical protein